MTKATDMLGNELHEGSLIFHRSTGLLFTVLDVNTGGVLGHSNGKPSPGRLTLKLELPFDSQKPIAAFQDFLAVLNPAHTAAIAEATKEVQDELSGRRTV